MDVLLNILFSSTFSKTVLAICNHSLPIVLTAPLFSNLTQSATLTTLGDENSYKTSKEMSAELINSGPFDLSFFPDIKTVSALQSHLILQHAVNITTCLSNTLTIDTSRGCISNHDRRSLLKCFLNVSTCLREHSLSQLYRPSRRQFKKNCVRLHVKFTLVLFDFIETKR